MARPTPVPRLSDHAVTRYVQRVLHVDIGVGEDEFTRSFVMHLHLYAAGITRAVVEAAVLTPLVVAAIKMGASEVRCPAGRLQIARDGCVATIWEERYQGRPKRFAAPSKRESRKGAQRADRRARKQRVWS